MTYPYVCRRAGELVVREAQWEVSVARRCSRGVVSVLALHDFELWRTRLIRFMFVPIALLVAYWIAWYADRPLIASDHSVVYVAFEQSFPLADAWLLSAMFISVVQLRRRRPRALLWLIVTGGAGVYLFALDVLYDLEHGVYASRQGGVIELVINVLTVTLSVALLRFAWRFRADLLRRA
jgi:hypothetical protein